MFQANKTINRQREWRNIADNGEHQEEITVLAADNLHLSMFISQNELQSQIEDSLELSLIQQIMKDIVKQLLIKLL
jgi:hypothetical protein